MSALKFSRFSALAAVLLCATFTFSQRAGQHEGSIGKFLANLQATGFDVNRRGAVPIAPKAMQMDPAKLCCEGIISSALFFNKAAPYVAIQLAQEFPLPAFRLRPDEAIVLIGVTPPPAQFFSYQLYLLERVYPPNTTRSPIFASLGDTVNLRTINTLGPDPFNRPVVFIFTPDQGTEARVRAALRSAGYPDAIINTLPFPAPMLNLGLEENSDVLLILHRMAMFTVPTAGDDYLKAFDSKDPNDWPLKAFLVTPHTMGDPHPFPTPPLRIRGTGRSEMDLTHTLAQLREGILKANSGLNSTEYRSRPMGYDGYDYIQRAENVFGDTRDALYLGAGWMPDFDMDDEQKDTLTLADGEFLVAYGPRHVATGKATYSNINVYASDKVRMSLASVFSDRLGSAVPYLPNLPKDQADLMYVHKFARNCNGDDQNCKELQAPPSPCRPRCEQENQEDCPEFVFGPATRLGLLFRNYLEPSTKVGPAFTEILYDQVIKFSPQPQK